jgi:hypothetical protein
MRESIVYRRNTMFDIDVDTLDPVGEFGSAAWCQAVAN